MLTNNGTLDLPNTVNVETLKVTDLYIDGDLVTATADELNALDGMLATADELNLLNDLTSTADELNILDGATISTDDLNLLTGLNENRSNSIGNRAVVLTANGTLDLPNTVKVETLKVTDLYIDGDLVTATADELNALDGMLATADELNLLNDLTSSADELNILDGATISTDDLNLLSGLHENRSNSIGNRAVVLTTNGTLDLPNTVNIETLKTNELFIDGDLLTSTADELNVLDGILSTTAELNLLNNLTATMAELNILDGATVNTADLNLLAGLNATRTNAAGNKAVVLDHDGNVHLPNKVSIGELDVETLKIDGTEVTSSATELNALVGLTTSNAEFERLSSLSATVDELNILDGAEVTTADLNMLAGLENGTRTNSLPNKVVVTKEDGSLELQQVEMKNLDVKPNVNSSFKIDGVELTATAAELNSFNGLTVSSSKLNIMTSVTATAADINKLSTNASMEDLNLLTGLSTDRTNSNPDKAVVLDENGNLNIENTVKADTAIFQTLQINGETVTVTEELDRLEGLLSTTEEMNKLNNLTSTVDELNILDGATLSTSDLNLLTGLYDSNRTNDEGSKAVVLKDDGSLQLDNNMVVNGNLNVDELYIGGVKLNVTALELNTLNGITAGVEELNIMDGVTASTNEINKLDGLLVSTADLNLLKGREADRSNNVANRVVVLDENKHLNLPNDVTIDTADITMLHLNSVEVTASASDLNVLKDVTASADELNILDGATITTEELNKLDGILSSTDDLNLLKGLSENRNNSVGNRAVVLDENANLGLPGTTTVTGALHVNTFEIDGVEVTANATQLNILDGIQATTAELNTLKGIESSFEESDLDVLVGFLGDTNDLNKLYGTGFCKDQNGVLNPAETHATTCIANSFCADDAEVVGNGANYTDKTTCEAAADCGVIASTEQCAFTHDNFYTDTSSCSDASFSDQTSCENSDSTWTQSGTCQYTGCSDNTKLTENSCKAVGTCASTPITRATSLSFSTASVIGTTYYFYNNNAQPDISLCTSTAITFTRADAGHTLRVVKDTDCTGCDAATPSHNFPTSTVPGWNDVSGSSSQTYTFTAAGTYYYICTAHDNMVGKLTVQDCSSQVGNGATYVNNKAACNVSALLM